MPYQYGDIVIVSQLPDQNGVNPKDRPAVVVTDPAKVPTGSPLTIVAITTLLPGPVPADCVTLPWHPQGHARTRLRTNCAAACRWLRRVPHNRVIRRIGFVPGPEMIQIAARLAALRGPGAP